MLTYLTNFTMKTNLLLLCLLVVSSVQSQNLEQYVSKDATAVVEIDGGQIFSLIDFSDLEMVAPPSPDGSADLSQYGFNVKSKAYYFYEVKEDIGYQNFVVGITDQQKAEEFIMSMMPAEPTSVKGYKFVSQAGMTAAWNNNMAIMTYVDFPKEVYTMEDLKAEQEAEKEAMRKAAEDAGEPIVEEEAPEEDPYAKASQMEFQLMMKNMDAPYTYSDEEMTSKMSDNFMSIAGTNGTQSIRQVNSYTKGKKKNSSAYFWLKSLDDMVSNALPEGLASQMPFGAASMLGEALEGQGMRTGLKAISSNLIFSEDEIRIESDFGLDPALADSYADIYNNKMDKSFLNHFDQDEVLSYMSFSTDMAEMLKAYPATAQYMYGSYFPQFSDEMDIALDLIEVLLDEEAIGELITGDGLMVLHSIEDQEVTYKTTEYDDNLTAQEVEKTKTEPMPIFSVMMGSENKKIVSKMMRMAKKHGLANIEGSHYRIPAMDMGSPFDMYFTHNDGIVYLTNSVKKVSNYASGKKTRKPGKHRKALRKNAFNFYVNSSSVMEDVSGFFPVDPKTMDMVRNNYKEIYMTSGQVKDNSMNYDMIIKTSGAKGNSLKLLMDSMNSTLKGI